LLSNTTGEGVGRILDAMAIGFFVGLMIALSEDFFKEAWLEIEWQKNEKSTVSLGERPIIIGSSSESDIYLSIADGFPPVVGEISFKEKVITYTDYMSKKNTLLKNGSKITLGRIVITVNAVK
jgi:Ca-activated chloride channel family protein